MIPSSEASVLTVKINLAAQPAWTPVYRLFLLAFLVKEARQQGLLEESGISQDIACLAENLPVPFYGCIYEDMREKLRRLLRLCNSEKLRTMSTQVVFGLMTHARSRAMTEADKT